MKLINFPGKEKVFLIEVESKRASAPSFVKPYLKLFVLGEGKLLEHEDRALAPFRTHLTVYLIPQKPDILNPSRLH